MTKTSYCPFAAFSAIAILAFGVAAYFGLGHIQGPLPNMVSDLPAVTFATVAGAGLIDGINPCAFTVLLLFIMALLATVQVGGAQTIGEIRRRLIGLGLIYIGAIFLTFLALGARVLATASLFTRDHLSARVGALAAIRFGLWMLKDYFLPGWGPSLHAPVVSRIARAAAQRMTIPTLVVGGFLIGLCTLFPAGGRSTLRCWRS